VWRCCHHWDDAVWPAADSAPTRTDRRGGSYATYKADLLVERPLALAADVSELAGRVEASVRRLGELPSSRGLEGLARFLLRSEAIASSRIEGLQVSPQQVGLAEVAEEESLTAENVNRTAKKVAANISALHLVAYLNGGDHAPLVQAGLVHAQFETIHPFREATAVWDAR
jgi:Fic family protein